VRVLFLPDYREANAYQRALADALAELGIEVRADPTRRRRVLPVTEALGRHGRPDVIHVHWTEPYIASGRTVSRVKVARTLLELRLARRAGSRIVWTAHDLFRHDQPADPLERRFMEGLYGLSSAVIVHCASAVDALGEALGLGAAERSRLHVIPHGHYVGRYPDTMSRPEARERLGLPAEARVVAFVGWVRAYKGVAELVEAFGRVDDPSLRLVVAGRAVDDGYVARLRRLAGADERVQLELGFVADDELQVHLRAADVVAAPFLEIFTSGSVLLAMSFGRAVIAPRRGCVADTLDEAGSLLYDADDPAGLEGALRSALSGDIDLEALGRHNAASLERFAWPRIAVMTRDVYERVLVVHTDRLTGQ
jgi:glycosyltransferase involved in cell wall biosynthesis